MSIFDRNCEPPEVYALGMLKNELSLSTFSTGLIYGMFSIDCRILSRNIRVTRIDNNCETIGFLIMTSYIVQKIVIL